MELEEILRIAFWTVVFYGAFGLVILATYIVEWVYRIEIRMLGRRRKRLDARAKNDLSEQV